MHFIFCIMAIAALLCFALGEQIAKAFVILVLALGATFILLGVYVATGGAERYHKPTYTTEQRR